MAPVDVPWPEEADAIGAERVRAQGYASRAWQHRRESGFALIHGSNTTDIDVARACAELLGVSAGSKTRPTGQRSAGPSAVANAYHRRLAAVNGLTGCQAAAMLLEAFGTEQLAAKRPFVPASKVPREAPERHDANELSKSGIPPSVHEQWHKRFDRADSSLACNRTLAFRDPQFQKSPKGILLLICPAPRGR